MLGLLLLIVDENGRYVAIVGIIRIGHHLLPSPEGIAPKPNVTGNPILTRFE